jgi:PAS domain S-box-containing protein
MNYSVRKILSLRQIEFIIINQDLKIIEISPGVKHLVDKSDKLEINKDVRIPFPELIGAEEIIREILEGVKEKFVLEGTIRNYNSSPLYLDLFICKNIKEDDYSQEILILIENITEKMLMEQKIVQGINESNLLLENLTVAKQYIDQIVTSMADGLLVTTASGKIKTANPAAQSLLEYDETELIGQSISSFIPFAVDAYFPHSTVPIPQLDIETVCHTKYGKKVPIAFSCSIIKNELNHFYGYVYILRDMSDRQQAELAKQEFIAMINHELRTPISSIIGMTHLLLQTDVAIKQRDCLKTIENSGNDLLKIINDILDFSKIASGKLELETECFNIINCIYDILSLFTPQATQKGLNLSFVNNKEIPSFILGDITRIRQIFINLVSNAIKFTEYGGVEISIKAKKINDNYEYSNHYEFQFAIRDTGIGIPLENFDRLFKAFSQVNSSITRQYGGTGLGLVICKQLCELMGGRIWLETEQGIGSIFYFTIKVPVVNEGISNRELQEENEKIYSHIGKEYPLSILLVEDHTTNQKIIRLMLENMGYRPEVANNGLEALSALRSQPYDVVFMDIHMPEMDGLTATKYICEEWGIEKRPQIIALTATDSSKQRKHCLEFGMDDFLTKPVDIKELSRVLKKVGTRKFRDRVNTLSEDMEIWKDGQVFFNFPLISPSPLPPSPLLNPINPASLKEILHIAELNPEVDAVEFLLETIDDFLVDAVRFLIDMKMYLNQENIRSLRRLAHTFASSSATIGASNLALLCKELEQMAINELLEKAGEQICNIEAEYQIVQIALLEEQQKYR